MSNDAPNRFDLSSSAIQEFQEIYRNEFGEELTTDAAKEMAERLLWLYELLAKDK